MIIQTVEHMLAQALRNGMSLKQIEQRIPQLAAKKLNITVEQFHAQLAQHGDNGIGEMVARIVSQFTAAERAKIAKTL